MDVPCSVFKNPVYKRDDTFELLNHFVNTATSWIGSPEYQRKIQNEGLFLATEAPYLLHAIIAISASHLSYLHINEKKYRVAATIHYEHALRSYSRQLQNGIDAKNADAIIGCSYLQAILAFENVYRTLTNQASDVTGYDRHTAWLGTMQGVRALQATAELSSHLERCIWAPVLFVSDLRGVTACQNTDSHNDSSYPMISKALHTLCESPFDTLEDRNPYQLPLSILCHLMRSGSDISHDTVGVFIGFVGELSGEFVLLFKQMDAKAMLLIAYWCALISVIDQWWTVPSARAECWRICAHLDSVCDDHMRDLLRFPAARCGYILTTWNPSPGENSDSKPVVDSIQKTTRQGSFNRRHGFGWHEVKLKYCFL